PVEQVSAEGARKLLQAAIENEVQEYLQAHGSRRTDDGVAVVVRNGHLPERDLVTGVGPLTVRQPRVRHRDGLKYRSAILPRYLRRVPSSGALISTLYLTGGFTGDCTDPLGAVRGDKAA